MYRFVLAKDEKSNLLFYYFLLFLRYLLAWLFTVISFMISALVVLYLTYLLWISSPSDNAQHSCKWYHIIFSSRRPKPFSKWKSFKSLFILLFVSLQLLMLLVTTPISNLAFCHHLLTVWICTRIIISFYYSQIHCNKFFGIHLHFTVMCYVYKRTNSVRTIRLFRKKKRFSVEGSS